MSTVSSYPACRGCDRPMRPRGVRLAQAPGTMATGHSGKCKSCVQPNTAATRKPRPRKVKPAEELRLANAVAGLDRFMERRWQRGVEREPVDPVVYRPTMALAA